MVLANGGYKKFASKDDVLKELEISKGTETKLNLVFKEDAGALVKKGEENEIVQEINIKNNLQAPIYQGDKLGEVSYNLKGAKINSVDIVAEKSVQKSNLWTVTTELFNNWFRLNR